MLSKGNPNKRNFKKNIINFYKDTRAKAEFPISSCPKSIQTLEEIHPNLAAS